jgi:hypothetical protein
MTGAYEWVRYRGNFGRYSSGSVDVSGIGMGFRFGSEISQVFGAWLIRSLFLFTYVPVYRVHVPVFTSGPHSLASHHHALFVDIVFDGSGVDRRLWVVGARLVRPSFSLPSTYVHYNWTLSPQVPLSYRAWIVTVGGVPRFDIGASSAPLSLCFYLCSFYIRTLFLLFRGVSSFFGHLLPFYCIEVVTSGSVILGTGGVGTGFDSGL